MQHLVEQHCVLQLEQLVVVVPQIRDERVVFRYLEELSEVIKLFVHIDWYLVNLPLCLARRKQ